VAQAQPARAHDEPDSSHRPDIEAVSTMIILLCPLPSNYGEPHGQTTDG
jgi:hypothetical protein